MANNFIDKVIDDREFEKFRKTEDGGVAVAVVLETEAVGGETVPFFLQDATVTTPNVLQNIFNFTGPLNRKISKIKVSCRQSVTFNLLLNDTIIIASGRTGPARANVEFNFLPYYPIIGSDNIKLNIIQSYGPSTDIECYLMGSD